jgi:hypothetical protein
MSDRLTELHRQRALVAEQLVWLDREIAAAGGETPATPAASPPPITLPPPTHFDNDLPVADKILAEFRSEADLSPARTRQGCIWSFVGGIALLLLGLAAIYWLHYR